MISEGFLGDPSKEQEILSSHPSLLTQLNWWVTGGEMIPLSSMSVVYNWSMRAFTLNHFSGPCIGLDTRPWGDF